ncbi:MAG TPA: phosphodiester glycosidase family protein [Gemmatimonadaceae bacterium]|nr:phosphodiester glycosidase family protein [Gemmatimonadaceae bacterium]
MTFRLLVVSLLLAACAHPAAYTVPSLGAMPFPVDSSRAEVVAGGVTHRVISSSTGPWRINVLSVDLDRCNAAEAVASSDSTLVRVRTTDMLAGLARHETVLGGVNGDFFSLKTGSPTNLLVINGTVRTPPIAQPVLAFDSAGGPHIAFFTQDDGALRPFHPLEAVGGRPVLVRDSAIAPEVDTFGQPGFRARNPRTAAGIARGGKRLILVAVDGREYQNAGMTLREMGALMLALGARDAINLDGGGSTTMVVAEPGAGGALRVVNHPSDKGGERTVGDALAIVRRCR